jgi:hypothetical protein
MRPVRGAPIVLRGSAYAEPYHEAPERAEDTSVLGERVKSFAKQTGATSGRPKLKGRGLKEPSAANERQRVERANQ